MNVKLHSPITTEWIVSNAHHSDEEIQKDINDTIDEINLYKRSIIIQEENIQAWKQAITDRETFVNKLRALQKARKG